MSYKPEIHFALSCISVKVEKKIRNTYSEDHLPVTASELNFEIHLRIIFTKINEITRKLSVSQPKPLFLTLEIFHKTPFDSWLPCMIFYTIISLKTK